VSTVCTLKDNGWALSKIHHSCITSQMNHHKNKNKQNKTKKKH